jgi:hypothetical protein
MDVIEYKTGYRFLNLDSFHANNAVDESIKTY